jgi:hypothetical protein
VIGLQPAAFGAVRILAVAKQQALLQQQFAVIRETP